MTVKPWTFFMVAIAGWMNRQQQEVIQYLREESHILREKLGKRRPILNSEVVALWKADSHDAIYMP